MVLHTKKQTKLHLVKGRKSVKKKGKKSSVSSVKVRNRRLKTMVAAGAKIGAKQIDGGEEIQESMNVVTTITAPIIDVGSQSTARYRNKKAEKKAKKKERGKKYSRIKSEMEHTEGSIHVRRAKVKNGKYNGNGREKHKGKKKGISDKAAFVKSQMMNSFLDKFSIEQNKNDGGLIESATKVAKEAASMLAKKIAVALAPFFLTLFAVIGIVGVIVVAILAVIYNSPMALFFPQPETEYNSPRTVLCEYYKEFNDEVLTLEEGGTVITYQNSDNGAPVSNFNDTLMVYMVKYGTGRTGFVMDEEGKEYLREVFDEMNYMDSEENTVKISAGASLGKVVTTGYCTCSICCGKWAGGHTASGTVPKAKHTLAVDAYNPIVPIGTKIVMNGITYKVEDTGNFARYGTDFDIYFSSHSDALKWGKRTVEAFLADGNENEVEVTTSGTTVHNLTYEDYIALNKLDAEQEELLREMMASDLWDSYYDVAGGSAVAGLAMTKIGCHYDQNRRFEEGYYDCSSLVYRLYKEVGIVLPETSAAQGKYCYENAMIINKKDLKPGDLIFYSYKENEKFRNISHVAIYVGNGKMVHAANEKRGVVMDSLKTNKVVFYARPY